MKTKILCFIGLAIMIIPLLAFKAKDTRSIILMNDYTNAERNRLLANDIDYLGKEIAKNHKNPFTNITKKDFEYGINLLKSKVDKLNNFQVFAEMNKLLANIGDAHTGINYWDGYSYPITVEFFGDDLYVINADKSLEEILYAKVVSINGHTVSYICEQLQQLIPHENENWVKARLPEYISSPVYMYSLGLIPDEKNTKFTFEKENGKLIEKNINTLSYGKYPNNCISYDIMRNVYIYAENSEDYYWYSYLDKYKSVYFKYNVCADMKGKPFNSFNKDMFQYINNKSIDKFIIDLRHNSGGNSEIIQPLIKSLTGLAAKKPGLKVYIITGRQTFSSGVMAAVEIKRAVHAVTIVGEATGGSPNSFGEVKSFNLINSKLPVSYSVKYFQLTDDGADTINPDKVILPSIKDFKANNDVVLNYILGRK